MKIWKGEKVNRVSKVRVCMLGYMLRKFCVFFLVTKNSFRKVGQKTALSEVLSAILKFDFQHHNNHILKKKEYLNYTKRAIILHVTFTYPLNQGKQEQAVD